MQRFTTTALALVLAGGTAMADNHTAGATNENNLTEQARQTGTAMTEGTMDSADLIRTRDMTGGPVYSINSEAGATDWSGESFDAVGAEWDQIGEIEDIVLTRDGRLAGVVAEVGGFLDIGDTHVFLRVDDMKLVPVDDVSYALVVRQSEDQLEEMESVDEGFWD